MQPTPTKRAVIDPLRRCACRCEFCYYKYSDLQSVRPWPEVERDIAAAAERGNVAIDVTGGEPLLYHELPQLVETARSLGMTTRIITSIIAPNDAIDRALAAEPFDWLISMHGPEDVHDELVAVPHAREQQSRFLVERIAGRRFCVNTVMVRKNQHRLAEFAGWISALRPTIVNFINFNPHHEWRSHPTAKAMVADPRVTGPQLDEAIDILEAIGCGVNVRYYPMCWLKSEHRRCICNDLHVMFDSGEWDYDTTPKEFATYREWGVRESLRTEEKEEPCRSCGLQWVCGGANRYWHALANEVFGREVLQPHDRPDGCGRDEFFWYRQHNTRGMAGYR